MFVFSNKFNGCQMLLGVLSHLQILTGGFRVLWCTKCLRSVIQCQLKKMQCCCIVSLGLVSSSATCSALILGFLREWFPLLQTFQVGSCVFSQNGANRGNPNIVHFFPFDHKHVGHLSLSLSPFSSNGYFNDTRKKMVKQGC